jgi:hypothetical protein
MVLQVFCDDSGAGWRGPHAVFVLGGWLADSTTWTGFYTEWAAALSEPPSIMYFKMSEAGVGSGVRRKGQFKGWPHKARDEKVSRLAGIVKKYARLGIHFRLSQDEYRTSIGKSSRELNDPYFVGFYSFICGVIRFLADAECINEPIDFIFDTQLHQSDVVQSAYNEFLRYAPDQYKALIGACPRHEDDNVFLPLQAADMLAWHIRREQADQGTDQLETPAWEIFDIRQQQLVFDAKLLASRLSDSDP